jgi:hypothetical protein
MIPWSVLLSCPYDRIKTWSSRKDWKLSSFDMSPISVANPPAYAYVTVLDNTVLHGCKGGELCEQS